MRNAIISNPYSNFGCGSTYSIIDFDNYDFRALRNIVKPVDLRKRLPISSERYKLCYSSHSLEHLSYVDAVNLLHEFYRILVPNGILRIVIPDLECWAHEYLNQLHLVRSCEFSYDSSPGKDLEFIVALLIDDMTKETCDGVKMPKMKSGYYNKDYVEKFFGPSPLDTPGVVGKVDKLAVLKQKLKTFYLSNDKFSLLSDFIFPLRRRDPRKIGFSHKWMWDEMQLRYILEAIGFKCIQRVEPAHSLIKNWDDYHLDTDSSGRCRHPMSLYLEAVKPSG